MQNQSGDKSAVFATTQNFMRGCGFLPTITTETRQPDGSVVTVRTQAVRLLDQRKAVPVHHAIDTPPRFSDEMIAVFAAQSLVPLIELQYWLSWSNKLRINAEEPGFDVPPAEEILEFLGVTLNQYKREGGIITVLYSATDPVATTSTIPLTDLEAFIFRNERQEALSRETFLPALDALVGQYL